MGGIVQNNPLFALQVGVAVNSAMIVFMLFSNASTYNILFLLVASFFFKVIPWFTIRNTTIKTSDIIASFGLTFMYVGWILWEKKTTAMVNRFLRCLNLKR
jgi:predicted ABC-type sugar transport system permease subunit